MLFSQSFIFTSREDPKVAECRSQRFLLKGNFLFMVSSGIYSYLPLGWRVLDKINNIIRKHMNAKGAQELLMSALQPLEMWERTGRDRDLAAVMFRFKDRKEREVILGPTHEEEITEIVKKYVFSYKQLPFTLYQIQEKFRDEPRPRFGLLRSCEFIMKDAYSFNIDNDGLDKSYEDMRAAYEDIFKECGLEYIIAEADPGAMGGNASHEFMVPAPLGEDILLFCSNCDKHFKPEDEYVLGKEKDKCPQCKQSLKEERMIEVGHIFKLGTKYSEALEAFVLHKDGRRRPLIMGCYGIGVSRLLAAIAETNSDDKGIIWPKKVSPFDASLLILEEELKPKVFLLGDILQRAGFSVLIDDRGESAGVKFKDAFLLGAPYIFIAGKNYLKQGRVDVEIRKSEKKLQLKEEELVNFLKNGYH